MECHLFTCSKPFQLINLLNLPYDFTTPGVKRILLVVGHFSDAAEVAEKIREHCPAFSKVIYFRKRIGILENLLKYKPSRFYTTDDISKQGLLYSLLVKEVYIYEEGSSNYIDVSAFNNQPFVSDSFTGRIRKRVFWFFKTGDMLGSNSKTRAVYLYNHSFYAARYPAFGGKAQPFKNDLYEHLSKNKTLILNFFHLPHFIEEIRLSNVAVYLTNHYLNNKIIEELKRDEKRFDIILIKVHPQLVYKDMEVLKVLSKTSFRIIKESFLAEMMFVSLMENKNRVTIFHESSTACLYLKENERLKTIDFKTGSFRLIFDELRSHYISQ